MSDKALRALVIDPDPRVLANAVRVLAHKGIHVAGRITPEDSLDYVRRAAPDVVLLGLTFWEAGWGPEFLAASPETVVIPIVGNSEAPGIRVA
jgi:hypothetical protein